LASLKHKAEGDKLNDLSTDFWKSVNIWLKRYNRDGRISCTLRFFIFTTSIVSEGSFLASFLPTKNNEVSNTLSLAQKALEKSKSSLILPIKNDFDVLSYEEKLDFLKRIVIFDNSPRIGDIP
jgi:hypothetical protein